MRFGLQASLCNLCREVYNETKAGCFLSVFAVALLAEGVDRNVDEHLVGLLEMLVALLAEGVDRNWSRTDRLDYYVPVALLAEGVDRNWHYADNYSEVPTVALLAEGVDRNLKSLSEGAMTGASPSSRRAWIEI